MFPYNQQWYSGVNFGTRGSNVPVTQSNCNSAGATLVQTQNQQWLPCQPPTTAKPNRLEQSAASFYQSFSSSVQSSLIPQNVPVYQHPVVYPSTHRARITLVPKATGGFQASIVKRKRHRTMYTTEQLAVLESVYKKRPYITREDRQLLVQELKVSDTAVKVWFQNRRLREKAEIREAKEAAEMDTDNEIQAIIEEAVYGTKPASDESNNTNLLHTEVPVSSVPAKLDEIELKLKKFDNQQGYVMLDDETIGQIVDVIDTFLPADIDLDMLSTSESEDSGLTSTSSEDSDSSRTSVESVPLYEPISPPAYKISEDELPKWKPFSSDESLQKLFDLHFC